MTRPRLWTRLSRERSGSIALTFALALPVMIGATAFATDLGHVYVQRRALQGTTDVAALAAAGQPSKANEIVRRVLDENGFPDARFTLAFGAYRPDSSGARHFEAEAGGQTVRVEAARSVELRFATIFGRSEQTVGAQADASRTPVVSLSAGSRLASVEPAIVNSLLKPLLGVSIDLKLADYNALLTTKLPLKSLLSGLAQTLGEPPVEALLGDVLSRPVQLSVFLDLLSRQVDAEGQKPAGAALRKLAQQARLSPAKVTLGEALALDPSLHKTSIGQVSARLSSSVSVLGLVNSVLNQDRVGVMVETGVSLAGLAGTQVALMLGEPAQGGRSLSIADGLPRVATDQLRLRIETGLLSSLLSVIGGKLEIPLEAVVAGGVAEVVSVTCSDRQWEREVTVAIHPGLARLSLGAFGKPLAQANVHDRLGPAVMARLLGLPILEGSANVAVAGSVKTVTFRGNEIGNGTIKSGETKSILTGLLATVLGETKLKVLGLPIGLDLKLVENLLKNVVAPPVDDLLNAVLAVAGVKLGEMDVRVDDLVCGQARIVG